MEYQDELERMRDRRRREKARQQRHVQHQHYEGALRKERTGRRERAYEERELEIIDFDNLEPAPSRKKKVKKRKKHRFLFWKFLLLVLIAAGGFLAFKWKQTGTGFWTIAIFGVDSRNGNLEKGALSDVEMLCVIDRKTGEIKLVSVFRDTYMEINSDGTFHKINEAYSKGGHEQALTALERNLDLQIDDYATFNWRAVADAITLLGGIDLEISESEFKYINGFITETVESTGHGSYHLEHPGMNHLDGVQAVAYARLRLMDTDYNRTARQRLVIQLALNKAKEADFKTLTTVIQAVLPQLSTSIGIDDILPLARNIRKYHISETGGFPFSRGETHIGKKDCVIPLTLESNVSQLHAFLYGTENYQPSATVRQISARIAADSGMGEIAPNAPEAKVLGQKALTDSSSQGSGTDTPQGSENRDSTAAKPPEPSETPAPEPPASEISESSIPEIQTAGSEEETSGIDSTEELSSAEVSEEDVSSDSEEESSSSAEQQPDIGPGAGDHFEPDMFGPGNGSKPDVSPGPGSGPDSVEGEVSGPGSSFSPPSGSNIYEEKPTSEETPQGGPGV